MTGHLINIPGLTPPVGCVTGEAGSSWEFPPEPESHSGNFSDCSSDYSPLAKSTASFKKKAEAI